MGLDSGAVDGGIARRKGVFRAYLVLVARLNAGLETAICGSGRGRRGDGAEV